MHVEPYLFFEGHCDEAIAFYREALGAEVLMLIRFNESPHPEMTPPGGEDKVMHATLKIGESQVMASDGGCSGSSSFGGVTLSLGAEDVAEGEALFNALGDGGQVTMPWGKTFWSPGFGMVTDRFGVGWMVNVVE